jgi:hypothetical protein
MGYQFRASRSETATEVSSTVIDSENFRELRDATKPPHTIAFCMINPNENDLTRDEPLPTQLQSGEEEIGSSGREQFRRARKKISTTMSHTWDETKE